MSRLFPYPPPHSRPSRTIFPTSGKLCLCAIEASTKGSQKKCRWLGVHETRQEGGCRMDKTPSVWPIWSGLEKQSPRGRISSGPVVETQATFLSQTRPEQETRITDVKSVCALAPPISCRPGPTADLPRPSHHPSDGTRVPIASGPTPSTVHSIIRRPHQ